MRPRVGEIKEITTQLEEIKAQQVARLKADVGEYRDRADRLEILIDALIAISDLGVPWGPSPWEPGQLSWEQVNSWEKAARDCVDIANAALGELYCLNRAREPGTR